MHTPSRSVNSTAPHPSRISRPDGSAIGGPGRAEGPWRRSPVAAHEPFGDDTIMWLTSSMRMATTSERGSVRVWLSVKE